MLKLKCDRCQRELSEPGALIFSPPTGEAWLVEKYHICADCWPAIVAPLKGDGKQGSPHQASQGHTYLSTDLQETFDV
jgi:hypothetical protein